MSNNNLKIAQIDWQERGTPVSRDFDDIYFSQENGLEETRYVFLEGNNLPERFKTHTQTTFTVAETGFGTGLNFLTLWHAWKQYRQHTSASSRLHFISFEKYPLQFDDLVKSHQFWPILHTYASQLQTAWPQPTAGKHQLIFNEAHIQLDLWFGDVNTYLPQIDSTVDAWFLDGFAPSKNPTMWQESLFKHMASFSQPGSTFATFTAAGFVRRGLSNAGFMVMKQKGFGRKREMLKGIFPMLHHYK